ncbi:MAG: hypothetical protein GF392_02350 [Candidatus Omnitrophica bacterium]|nr:hypothetical protein [Candidatus Omnitrophota bacterium]
MNVLVLVLIILLPVCRAEAGVAEVSLPQKIHSFEVDVGEEETLELYIYRNELSTDLEGRLARPYRFYSLRFSDKNRYFNLNLPEDMYFGFDRRDVVRLVLDVLGLYEEVYSRFNYLFGGSPPAPRQNLTFGRTSAGHPFVRIYNSSKAVNIYTDMLPAAAGEDVLTPSQKDVLRHEIGHAAFSTSIGNFIHPKFKSIEEGAIDHLAYAEGKGPRQRRITISPAQSRSMRGLAQMDIDASIWGEDKVTATGPSEGYRGVTHHHAGAQFIRSFVEFFGEEELYDFLRRLKAKEKQPLEDDMGTDQIEQVLRGMGRSTSEIKEFEKNYHRGLRENVFVVE